MKHLAKILFLPIVACMVIGGCAKDLSPNTYDEGTVGQTQTVDTGIIIGAQEVAIKGKKEGGTMVGAAAGGVAGSYLGGDWRMNILGAIGGAIVGAFTGGAAEEALTDQTGVRYLVKLDSAYYSNTATVINENNQLVVSNNNPTPTRVISVVQGKEPLLTVGQRVLVLDGGTARARVIADTSQDNSSYKKAWK